MNEFIGEGNLGQEPDVRVVTHNGENNDVANLRIYFDRPVANAEGNFEDKKGFWLNVEVWGDRAQARGTPLHQGQPGGRHRIIDGRQLRNRRWPRCCRVCSCQARVPGAERENGQCPLSCGCGSVGAWHVSF